MKKGMVTIKSAAEILGVSVETLRNWDKTGKLVSERDPQNKYRLYRITEIQNLLKNKVLKQKREKRGKLID